jgi:Icc-related predicted phosphoesterase
VRLAAVGDLHAGVDFRGQLRAGFDDLAARADLLLLAGDLTQHGMPDEGEVLADELRGVPVPMLGVLGNHDYHHGDEATIRRLLESVGVTVLEGEGRVITAGGVRVGVAGVKGFGGGFAGACGTEFGEPEMKAFIRHTKETAHALRDSLEALDCDLRVALTHYAPSNRTLAGEQPQIYPFLGSYLLGEAIDHSRCDLALHGHAHRGRERGVTPGGVPVRNVARPVIQTTYRVYCLSPGDETPVPEAEAAP